MSSDKGLSIFDEPESSDEAAEETQVLPVTPKDEPKAKPEAAKPQAEPAKPQAEPAKPQAETATTEAPRTEPESEQQPQIRSHRKR